MTISRRRLLAGLGSVGAVSASHVRVAGAAPARLAGRSGGATATTASRTRLDLGTCTADTFRPHVGTVFRLRRPGQTGLRLRLREVRRGPEDDQTRSFSLTFSVPRGETVGQATSVLVHRELGRFQILLVPVRRRRVEAVINHLRPGAG